MLQKPKHITSLATSSILLSVDINVWTATKQDRVISDEITTAKKADRDSGRFVKHLLAANADHKRVINYRQSIYNWLERRTYDWSASQRCLPSVMLPVFMKEYRQHEATFHQLVDDFVAKYPNIVSSMAFSQGDMFDRNEYPTPDQVRGKFSMRLFTGEVPLGDYRCTIAQDLADDLFNNYNRQAEQIIQDILQKQQHKLVNVMTSLSHCCDVDNVINMDGQTKVKKRKIYDTTVIKALELCDEFKSFNLAESPELEDARQQLEQALQGVNADMLRESDVKRKEVKDSVDSILSKFRIPGVEVTPDAE